MSDLAPLLRQPQQVATFAWGGNGERGENWVANKKSVLLVTYRSGWRGLWGAMQSITNPQMPLQWLMTRGQQPHPTTLGKVLAPSPTEQLETTYRQCSDRLLRFAATISGSSAAEDVLSTAVTKVLTSQNLEEISDFEKYLFRSVANVGRSHWRSTSRRSQREEAFSRLTNPSSTPGHEIAVDFSKEMLTLSPQQRAIVHLRYWEDLTTPVIANTLGISEGSVKRQLSRSLQKLRIEFADA